MSHEPNKAVIVIELRGVIVVLSYWVSMLFAERVPGRTLRSVRTCVWRV